MTRDIDSKPLHLNTVGDVDDPDDVFDGPSAVDRIEALEQQVKELRWALEFYASWDDTDAPPIGVAIEALAALEKADG
jgi:hypothetical protein